MPGRGSYARIYEVVKTIPKGHVATYGQVAALAGMPGHARQVGYALNALQDESGVPWQRVVNARGAISRRTDPQFEWIQRTLLEEEGVQFDAQGQVSLARYRWRPNRSQAN
jgi:methylated-DNA-protein-cysteine methyltransferase-like protein